MATVWMGPVPEKCDTCDTPIDGKFYDAATKMGPWACMCPSCQALGPGRWVLVHWTMLDCDLVWQAFVRTMRAYAAEVLHSNSSGG